MRKSFKLDTRAFSTEVINADFMVDFVRETANEIAQKAGDGFEAEAKRGRKRALGMVRADSFKARKDDNDNNTLMKAAYPLQVVQK